MASVSDRYEQGEIVNREPVVVSDEVVDATAPVGPIARMIAQFKYEDDPVRAERVAARLLPFMEEHLTGRSFLATEHPTLADLACYSYVAHAPEGGIPLDPYPAVRAWLARVEALPFFKPIPPSPIPVKG